MLHGIDNEEYYKTNRKVASLVWPSYQRTIADSRERIVRALKPESSSQSPVVLHRKDKIRFINERDQLLYWIYDRNDIISPIRFSGDARRKCRLVRVLVH